jgi:hypothetical protein
MYLVREGKCTLRAFANYDEAYARYSFVARTSQWENIELYKLDDDGLEGLCTCIESRRGEEKERLLHARNVLNLLIESL